MSTDDQTDPRGVRRNRPETVDALASTVISVLRDRQATSAEGLREFALSHLVRACVAPVHFQPDAMLEELRGYRLSLDALIDLYVPAAARVLGEKWVDDQLSFADVTIGSLRLQALLEEASAATRPEAKFDKYHLHALMVVPAGEQHFLGASVVAAQLRRVGCEVIMSYDDKLDVLAARLLHDCPDLVLITCARAETLEYAQQVVQTIRTTLKDGPVIAVGGALQVDKEEVKERTGADIVTSIAAEAVAYCSKHAKPMGSL